MEGMTFFDGLLEQVEFEHKLFESVLKVNFRKAQIIKEDGELSSQKDSDEDEDVNPTPAQADQDTDEEVKKKFTEKIREGIDKIIEWFKKMATIIAEKIQNIIYSDNKIIKKYNEILTTQGSKALKGFPGIANFRPAKVDGYQLPIEEVKTVAKGSLAVDDFLKIAKVIEDQCAFAFEEEAKEWNKDGSANYNWAKAFEFLSNGRINTEVLSVVKLLAANKDSLKQKLLEKRADSIINGNLFVTKDDKKNIVNAMSSAFKTFLTTYTAYFKAVRRACIVCGTYALKAMSNQAGENATDENQAKTESLCWLTDLQCVQYLDEAFSFT